LLLLKAALFLRRHQLFHLLNCRVCVYQAPAHDVIWISETEYIQARRLCQGLSD
jgi:hypothetical protein